jgi:uncharacterized protein (DUF433 family)
MGATTGSIDRISIDPRVCEGKPVIRGTRVQVSSVLTGIIGGDTLAEAAAALGISEDDVRAAVAYASEMVHGDGRPAR